MVMGERRAIITKRQRQQLRVPMISLNGNRGKEGRYYTETEPIVRAPLTSLKMRHRAHCLHISFDSESSIVLPKQVK